MFDFENAPDGDAESSLSTMRLILETGQRGKAEGRREMAREVFAPWLREKVK